MDATVIVDVAESSSPLQIVTMPRIWETDEATRAGETDYTAVVTDVASLYALIKSDPYALEKIDNIPFVHTPLHVAAAAGEVSFAAEIMNLKPTFARKLNQDGLSPMHLAFLMGHNMVLSGLLGIDPELVRVKGKGGKTLLHLAVETDNIDLLSEFLVACPAASRDRTAQFESPLHVAVRWKRLRALKILLRWCSRGPENTGSTIHCWMDGDGNTFLHAAALTNQLQVVKVIMEGYVDSIPGAGRRAFINTRNWQGKTAVDLSEEQEQKHSTGVTALLLNAGGLGAQFLPPPPPKLADTIIELWPQKEFRLTDIMKMLISIPLFYRQSGISIANILQLLPKTDINFPIVMNLSTETRSTVLVVTVLVATASYQMGTKPSGLGENAIMDAFILLAVVVPNFITFVVCLNLITKLIPTGTWNLVVTFLRFLVLWSFAFSAASMFLINSIHNGLAKDILLLFGCFFAVVFLAVASVYVMDVQRFLRPKVWPTYSWEGRYFG